MRLHREAPGLKAGAEFPPIVVFHDGSTYWLADGFHRFMAARSAGLDKFPAVVHQGTRREAILYSVGSNSAHGLPRTNADKRRAVMMLLKDEEWAKWSDSEIARQCSVDHKTVGRHRKSLGKFPSDDSPPPLTEEQQAAQDKVLLQLDAGEITRDAANAELADIDPHWANRSTPRTYTTKHGTEATMRTENIGQ